MNRAFSSFSWGSTSFSVNVIKNQNITLPVKNGEIDFDFIEEYIRELESQKLNKVKEYINCILGDNINLIGGVNRY